LVLSGHATNVSPIPTYGLYSDAEAQSSAGFVHIETIAIRSSLHDWEIKPHRHDHGIQVLIVTEGHADVTLDGEGFALSPPVSSPCRWAACMASASAPTRWAIS
jgi:hypothetical protein